MNLNIPKTYKNFEDRWGWLLAYMTLEDRFVHEILMMMTKKENNRIKTMGVMVIGSTVAIGYNRAWVDARTDSELCFKA